MKQVGFVLLLLLPTGFAVGASAVRGQVVVDGEVPPAEALPPGRDACCQAAKPVDQSVVVGPDGGLANVLVSVEPRRGEPKPPAPAGTLEQTNEPVTLTNRGCAFTPRVLVVRVGQPLVLANADPTMHNVDIAFVRNAAVNLVVEPDGRRELSLLKAERRAVAARCNVHTFMRAWIVVRDDPFAAVTDDAGQFELPELSPGEWRLRFWREGLPLAGVAVGVGTTDERGELLITITAEGTLDLGEIRVAANTLR